MDFDVLINPGGMEGKSVVLLQDSLLFRLKEGKNKRSCTGKTACFG